MIRKRNIELYVEEVTVLATETTGTATVVKGSTVIGIVPVSNQDQFVDSVLIDDVTCTVTIAAAATADNVFNVIVLK